MSDNFTTGNVSIKIEGMEELQQEFQKLIRKYPDKAGELLQQEGKDLRKDMVSKIKGHLDVHTENKMSLGRESSYTVSQPKGLGESQYVEVTAKSPHFHLLENGHEIVIPKTRTIVLKNGSKKKVNLRNGGQKKGFVAGYQFADEAARKKQEQIPKIAERMIDELLKEGGFI